MKKVLLLITMPLIFLALNSCSEPGHKEYRTYMVPEALTVAPGTETFVAVRVEIPQDGHIYGNPKGPGTGKATEVSIKKTPFLTPGKARFLTPEKYTAPGEEKHVWVHKNETTVFLPLTVSSKAPPGKLNLQIDVDILLCDESTCIPKAESLILPLEIKKGAPGNGHSTAMNQLFKKAASGEVTKKEITSPRKNLISTGITEKYRDSQFKARYPDSSGVSGILQAILFGLLAGFILNFMPCVLPVVSLKIMSFINNAGESRREVVRQGLLFSAGILVSFSLLAVLAAYFGYSWGGLFQHELFLVFMTALVFVLALSLFHVFTINMPSFAGKASESQSNRYSDAFMKGLLATLLATPCSGPFLGGTLAWALTQSPVVIFVIFISVGVGMAFPYLVLSFSPGLMRFVPKPGEWMTAFETAMGFLLVFTAIYLMTIMQAPLMLPMVLFLAFLSVGFWQFGKYGAIFQPKKKRILSLALLLLIGTGGYGISFHYFFGTEVKAEISASDFSAQRLYSNRDAGRISVVKFTADWCPNCRLVESLALETADVAAAVKKYNADFMTADITVKDSEAENLMHLLGSRSIPFLAVFPAGSNFNRPWCLRDIYSEEEVLSALEKAGRETSEKSEKTEFKFQIR